MILDTSVLVALLREEPEAELFLTIMSTAARLSFSAASHVELGVVVTRNLKFPDFGKVNEVLAYFNVAIVPVTAEHARIAREAYRTYGQVSGSPAKLNFGDCFPYALAKATGEPLLFKGDDFIHTDVVPALKPI